jgi:hypothetical protein
MNVAAVPSESTTERSLRRALCAAFGHRVGNSRFEADPRARRCQCGADYLREDGSVTRAAHTLSCFFLGHRYTRMAERDGHAEVACDVCGHPLLFETGRSPYAARRAFTKQVRYACGLFGHEVHPVARRHGMTEYACRCGHSFLLAEAGRSVVRHPLACVAAGHAIRFLERRAGRAEFLCERCGHPFCFASP